MQSINGDHLLLPDFRRWRGRCGRGQSHVLRVAAASISTRPPAGSPLKGGATGNSGSGGPGQLSAASGPGDGSGRPSVPRFLRLGLRGHSWQEKHKLVELAHNNNTYSVIINEIWLCGISWCIISKHCSGCRLMLLTSFRQQSSLNVHLSLTNLSCHNKCKRHQN